MKTFSISHEQPEGRCLPVQGRDSVSSQRTVSLCCVCVCALANCLLPLGSFPHGQNHLQVYPPHNHTIVPPLSVGDMFLPRPPWMPEIKDRTKPCIYYGFSNTASSHITLLIHRFLKTASGSETKCNETNFTTS